MIEVLLAAPKTLTFGLAVALPACAIAALLGGWSGYAGGRVGAALDFLADTLLALPRLVLLLVVIGMLRRAPWWSLWTLAGVLAALSWAGLYRLVAAQARAVRGRAWVEAAIGLGQPRGTVFLRHVLPHCLGPVRAQVVPLAAGAILAQAALAWLGLESRTPDTWGGLIARARPSMLHDPAALFLPVLAIALVTAAGQILANREDG